MLAASPPCPSPRPSRSRLCHFRFHINNMYLLAVRYVTSPATHTQDQAAVTWDSSSIIRGSWCRASRWLILSFFATGSGMDLCGCAYQSGCNSGGVPGRFPYVQQPSQIVALCVGYNGGNSDKCMSAASLSKTKPVQAPQRNGLIFYVKQPGSDANPSSDLSQAVSTTPPVDLGKGCPSCRFIVTGG